MVLVETQSKFAAEKEVLHCFRVDVEMKLFFIDELKGRLQSLAPDGFVARLPHRFVKVESRQ
jgi:hypothetical protein